MDASLRLRRYLGYETMPSPRGLADYKKGNQSVPIGTIPMSHV